MFPLVIKIIESCIIIGEFSPLGSTFTSIKTKRLSFEGISISVKYLSDVPLILILKFELSPLAKRIDEMLIFELFLLYILNCFVVEPIVVNTVSNITVSVENFNLASGEEIISSLLHENSIIRINIGMISL